MNGIFQPQRVVPGVGSGRAGAEAIRSLVYEEWSGVIESPAEQSWTDFCRTLNRPAILLGDSDVTELEQA